MQGESIVQGLATYGRFKSYASTVVTVLISAFFFAAGLAWASASRNDLHTALATGVIKNVSCDTRVTETRQNNGTVSRREDVTCVGDVTYAVGGTTYTAQRMTYGTKLADGAQVSVYYNPVNPNDVVSERPAPPMWGYLLAGGACLIAVGSVIYSGLMNKSKSFAAIHGTREALGDAGNLIRGVWRVSIRFQSVDPDACTVAMAALTRSVE